MNLFVFTLVLTTLLVALVAGLVFTFAVVVMPGLASLSDRAYLAAFKAMDRIIQDGQPLFMIVWLGSMVGLVLTVVLGWNQVVSPHRALLITAVVLHLGGVMVPTARYNIPANNRVQRLDLAAMDAATLRDERARFEPMWVRWNTRRTVVAILVTVILLVVLWRQGG